jgi:anti-anti-sigma regulatory factor
VIHLNASMGLSAAEALREQLLHALNQDGAIEIDASALEDIDVSVIQVLISAHKTATKLNRTFKLASPPNGALADALKRGGFMDAAGQSLVKDGAFWTGKM